MATLEGQIHSLALQLRSQLTVAQQVAAKAIGRRLWRSSFSGSLSSAGIWAAELPNRMPISRLNFKVKKLFSKFNLKMQNKERWNWASSFV
jgi:hypothetical protein